jgi:hypothetical protein
MRDNIKSLYSSLISAAIALCLYWFIRHDWVEMDEFFCLCLGSFVGICITYYTTVSGLKPGNIHVKSRVGNK